MFPFLPVFLIFVIVLNICLRKNNRAQASVIRQFWEKELRANKTRKQDISHLDYITIPSEKIPQILNTDTEKELLALASRKMLNLEGQSNTDLKLKYGVANLTALGEYEENFARFQALLPVYAVELLDAGREQAARELLEFAVDHRGDARPIYRILSDIYIRNHEEEKLAGLLAKAQSLHSMAGEIIARELMAHQASGSPS